MDLRRRSKNRVVEAMARIVALLPIGQEPARPNCDVDIDRVDSVPEGCNESVKTLMQRVSPFRIAMATSFDDGFDLDQRGRRELMSLDPASEGGSFWHSGSQAFEQGGVDQPGVQNGSSGGYSRGG